MADRTPLLTADDDTLQAVLFEIDSLMLEVHQGKDKDPYRPDTYKVRDNLRAVMLTARERHAYAVKLHAESQAALAAYELKFINLEAANAHPSAHTTNSIDIQAAEIVVQALEVLAEGYHTELQVVRGLEHWLMLHDYEPPDIETVADMKDQLQSIYPQYQPEETKDDR